MKLSYGRVLKAEELGSAVPITPAAESDEATTRVRVAEPPQGRVVRQSVVDAAEQARALLSRAEAEAAKVIARAEREAADLRLRAETEGRADAAASLAAHAIALSARESESLERELDRIVELARVLAERLLGESLALDPNRVVSLARQAIAEARGARAVTIVAHPEDAERLEQALAALSLGPAPARISRDPRRPRHSLRLETDIGVLDADVAPQLERLALKLRETLGS